MDKDELLKLDNQVCFALYACSREITKLYRPILSDIGLTYTQYITMLALWEKDSVTVKELGSRLLLDSGTLTPLLKKLESMGHIVRGRDKVDERNLVIKVTEKGMQLKELAYQVPLRLFKQLNLTPEEAIVFRDQAYGVIARMDSNI
ncbi:MarR family winged helix-turn-helix transcriptional regulator [Paenibacillus sp. NEAU-GSW1]|uniref:MarR family winged helix-turn-helix transcriptional regulator n=1 Tax=Paenibacillus sp. NEAU-GSW1 TaxID=2682486 RepID=UPI0012E223E5|nr:MarR family transcriptional regulator [Paenibacillus sp. NEAU-GSW1]MUT66534.1 MarR family transcriptional regulator [Paenibacillus sp. NEAU-GSW1]